MKTKFPEILDKKMLEQTNLIIELGRLLDSKTIYINGLKAQGIINRVNELQASIDAETKEYHKHISNGKYN